MMPPSLDGIPIVLSQFIAHDEYVQFRRPRSKRKRIRKKWQKDGRNWRWQERPQMYVINMSGQPTIITNGAGLARLRRQLQQVGHISRRDRFF